MTALSTREALQTESQTIYYTALAKPLGDLVLVYKGGDVDVKE